MSPLLNSLASTLRASDVRGGRPLRGEVPPAAEPTFDIQEGDIQEYREGILTSALGTYDTCPDLTRDESEYIHWSSLIHGVCPRQLLLGDRYGSERVRLVQRGQRLIWKLGRAAEEHARTLLSRAFPRQAYGVWKCNCRRSSFEGTRTDALSRGVCSVCGWKLHNYWELVLWDEEHKTVGSPDFLLALPQGLIPVEFKSINKKGFESVQKRAVADHVLQALGYVRMGRAAGYSMAGFGVVKYVAKEYKWGQVPYREHKVTERGYKCGTAIDLMEQTALTVKQFREGRGSRLPERLGACHSADTSRAAKCPACAICFSV